MSQLRQNSRKGNFGSSMPECQEETLDIDGKVFFIVKVEETD